MGVSRGKEAGIDGDRERALQEGGQSGGRAEAGRVRSFEYVNCHVMSCHVNHGRSVKKVGCVWRWTKGGGRGERWFMLATTRDDGGFHLSVCVYVCLSVRLNVMSCHITSYYARITLIMREKTC